MSSGSSICNSMQQPAAMAREGVHETVESIFKDRPRGRVLDVPAGHGSIAHRLERLGFDVSACDLYPEIFELKDVEIRKGDLDDRLPYDDGSFDHIVCVEGLEHIENPANAIREFARVMNSGGTLVVSVPNIMNIEERLKWLFNGYTSHFKPLSSEALAPIREEYAGIEEAALHVNPIGYSELRYLLESNGFAVESTFRDKKKKNAGLFIPLAWIIRAVSKFSSADKRRQRWTDEMNSDEVLLGGNTLIIKARKL